MRSKILLFVLIACLAGFTISAAKEHCEHPSWTETMFGDGFARLRCDVCAVLYDDGAAGSAVGLVRSAVFNACIDFGGTPSDCEKELAEQTKIVLEKRKVLKDLLVGW